MQHAIITMFNLFINSPHEFDPHCPISLKSPMHSSPPCTGVGLVQLLSLVFVPSAHTLLQGDVLIHDVQPPCIGTA